MQFRDIVLEQERVDKKIKHETTLIPAVTCDILGNTEDSNSDPIDASVDEEPNRVWVRTFNDAVPQAVLNDNVINPQTGLLVFIGYLEGSAEIEIIRQNRSVLGETVDTTDYSSFAGTFTYVDRSLFPILKTTTSSGLIVAVSALEYDRFGGHEIAFSTTLDLTSFKPAAGFISWTLIYLDAKDGAIEALAGDTVLNIASASPVKPDTPVDGIASAYVKLSSATTTIATEDIAEAKRITTPNIIPGVSYNLIVRSINVPANYTMIRGQIVIQTGQTLSIESGGRIIIL